MLHFFIVSLVVSALNMNEKGLEKSTIKMQKCYFLTASLFGIHLLMVGVLNCLLWTF